MIITIDMVTGEETREGGTKQPSVVNRQPIQHAPVVETAIQPVTQVKERKRKVPVEIINIKPDDLISRMTR